MFDLHVFVGVYRQLIVPFEHLIDELQTGTDIFCNAVAVIEGEFLRQYGTAQIAHSGEAGIFRRRFTAGDDPHKGGFTAAVSADQCDFFSGRDGKISMVKQYLTADSQGQVFGGKENFRHNVTILC